MAQINASYQRVMANALPGMVAATSKYIIDDACVGNEGDVFVGAAVQVVQGQAVDGHKLVKAMESSKVPYAVAIRSHWQTVNRDNQMIYEDVGANNVMTSGRVWMLSKSEKAPTFGTAAKLDVDGQEKSDGTIETTWTYVGGWTKYRDIQPVEVQLHQQ
ncbi:hypothetical protein HOS16_gp37 [Shigella phage vB_SflS-ISF001]|uniref:Uncharacterized protein n=1 Tax=Shigella phage vB_SflS-ISF001 TaxID=2048005 RepID=A0A2D1GQ73_9CAUD|nr:hypothetical protein HOS16_gp37 [Shigella phage vB_SflS-ISF001]ATN94115.1 hypothetical protein FLXISF001_037 [Shigella phage vB_SflS-ISF001]